MSTYVRVHGAWHGAWCWKKAIPLLEKEGHELVALDLPGHGEDKTPIADITPQACAPSLICCGNTRRTQLIGKRAAYG